MDRKALAARLVIANQVEYTVLLADYADLVDIHLADTLKDICLNAWRNDPPRAIRAAAALAALTETASGSELQAVADWAAGVALMINGQMEPAIVKFERAAAQYSAYGQPHSAASVQASKLAALSALGRYEEAIRCGLQARSVLLGQCDYLAVGQIEQRLGELYHRRARYREAEHFYLAARERFLALDDRQQLIQIDVCLATTLNAQHKFRAAAQIYEQALEHVSLAGMDSIRAEIECNLGTLALFQGHYARALAYLARAHRSYEALEMPHMAAIAELELADAYLELNMASDAAAIYARVVSTFTALGLRLEQARGLVQHGRAQLLMGRAAEASDLLAQARELYMTERNIVGAGMVALVAAQLHYLQGDYAAAAQAAVQAEEPLTMIGAWGRLLLARWLYGQAICALGQDDEAEMIWRTVLHDAERQALPEIARLCHTSLGLVALTIGDLAAAEASFTQAVALIEHLRAPLLVEELRTAFIADKLTPYTELVRLCLDDDAGRAVEALGYVERARARVLIELLEGVVDPSKRPRDQFDAERLARLAQLREELNWLYTELDRSSPDTPTERLTKQADIYQAVRERETAIVELRRQFQQHDGAEALPVNSLDIARLQRELGADTALVEYFSLDGEFLAFVVTHEWTQVVRGLGRANQVEEALRRLRLPIETLRYGANNIGAYLEELTARMRHVLTILYDLLLRPVEALLGGQRMVVVPHQMLHYVPFHALYDGQEFVIERREVCYAPSATVLCHCLTRPKRAFSRAVLLGVPDERIPRVRDEIVALASLFAEPTVLLDRQATLAALLAHAPSADVLHLASHGQFRSDNPLFSSLRLADGWLTVGDTYDLELDCSLVTLSACETGVNSVMPGDELLGLARGFFSAGAATLLVSLWTIDDEATARLMTSFYRHLRDGWRPAAALRSAQRHLLEERVSPAFWAPFMLLGRW